MKDDEEDDPRDSDRDSDRESEPDFRLNGQPPEVGRKQYPSASDSDSEYESESSGLSAPKANKRSIDEVLNRLNKNNNHCKK